MFAVKETTGTCVITFDQQPILEFTQEHLCFRGFRADNLRLRPGGPVEFITFNASCFYFTNLLRARIHTCLIADHEIEVILTPEKVAEGLDEKIYETRTFNIRYNEKQRRFVYRIDIRLDVRENIHGKDSGIPFIEVPHWGNDDYAVLEIDDPLLNGGKGPQVPMTQDWVGQPEPSFHEDCFTTRWHRRYNAVILNTSERGIRRLTFNRSVNSIQQYYNRHILKTVSRAPYYYEKINGTYVKFTPDFEQPVGHHICEWGYDMHWWALITKADAAQGLYLRQGDILRFGYTVEEVERDEVPADYLCAEDAGMTAEEYALADRPVYEEPECHFTVSAIDCPDSGPWQPGNGNCLWNRGGGRDRGNGALEIHHGDILRTSTWSHRFQGPTHGCNPIPPRSRFRVTAWVQAEQPDKVKLSHELNSYHGPGMFSLGTTKTMSTGTVLSGKPAEGEWSWLEFITAPCGPYCLDGRLEFSYAGKGTARLSLLSVKRL